MSKGYVDLVLDVGLLRDDQDEDSCGKDSGRLLIVRRPYGEARVEKVRKAKG